MAEGWHVGVVLGHRVAVRLSCVWWLQRGAKESRAQVGSLGWSCHGGRIPVILILGASRHLDTLVRKPCRRKDRLESASFRDSDGRIRCATMELI